MGQISLRFATEVRHTLHSMLGFLELAVEEPLSERQMTYLSQCRSGADRLLRIASDLWELSQPEPAPQMWTMFQVSTAVTEVADMARVFADRKGLALHCNLAPGSQLRIQGVRGLIQDTLQRLLDNAVKYTASGAIHLSADVRVEGAGASLMMEVADTGDGMPEDILTAIRTPGINALPERALSLAVVRRRINRMEGVLSVVSSPNSGTIVRVTIPVPLASRRGLDVNRDAPDHGQAARRVLIAEDSDDSFLVFEGFVTNEGHELTRAYDGAQAVELAQTGRYDIIVMDANMPVMDGYQATRTIREWESDTSRAERTPIILFSADDPLTQAKLGGAAGCSGYLAKPATKSEVLRALNFFASYQPILAER